MSCPGWEDGIPSRRVSGGSPETARPSGGRDQECKSERESDEQYDKPECKAPCARESGRYECGELSEESVLLLELGRRLRFWIGASSTSKGRNMVGVKAFVNRT